MCNDYEQHVRWADYCKMMRALELAIPSHQGELDLPEADDFRINDIGTVMRAAGSEIELVPMSFSFPPGRPGGAPVFNFRSEGRHCPFDVRGSRLSLKTMREVVHIECGLRWHCDLGRDYLGRLGDRRNCSLKPH
jgi:hypothetical protein